MTAPDSALRVQLQRDSRYARFADRSERRVVLGLDLPVARIEDLLQGKIWEAEDSDQRPSKRLEDLADIARLVEEHPVLKARLPRSILEKISS